ncbi:tyrosine-type recombinase/integrase [Nitrosospira sp. Nsp1]|uniref:tyrosine-type recombinase/integrase n=1 Tax=Nitrosospira sp. Nsp1 TaxID=136547 RepID=UPI0015A41DA8|nr:tyrosine-type recombinase/integrase [Nitrosospira sp. Nsp1]
MADLIESFLEFKQRNAGRSDRTIHAYRLALTRMAAYFVDQDLLRITQDELLAFTGPYLHKMGLRDPVSRRPHVAAVRGFYSWLASTKRIRSNPAENLPYPDRGRRIPRVMTLGSAAKLMWEPDFNTFAGVRDGAILALLVGCGLRVSGLVALNESNIIQDEIDGKVRMLIKVVEKGDKERKLTIPPEADLLLRLYLDHAELKQVNRRLPDGDQVLFVSLMNRTVTPDQYHGEARRLNRRAVLQMVKRYGKRAGISEDQLHPHAMRHLFGTELAEDSVDIIARQRLLGHKDVKSTAIYDHMAMRKLTREADRANPLAKIKTPVSDLLKRLNKRP